MRLLAAAALASKLHVLLLLLLRKQPYDVGRLVDDRRVERVRDLLHVSVAGALLRDQLRSLRVLLLDLLHRRIGGLLDVPLADSLLLVAVQGGLPYWTTPEGRWS